MQIGLGKSGAENWRGHKNRMEIFSQKKIKVNTLILSSILKNVKMEIV